MGSGGLGPTEGGWGQGTEMRVWPAEIVGTVWLVARLLVKDTPRSLRTGFTHGRPAASARPVVPPRAKTHSDAGGAKAPFCFVTSSCGGFVWSNGLLYGPFVLDKHIPLRGRCGGLWTHPAGQRRKPVGHLSSPNPRPATCNRWFTSLP